MTACAHRLVVDEPYDWCAVCEGADPEGHTCPDVAGGPWHVERRCLFCGVGYDRTRILDRLRRGIRDRHRLPSSPWSAAERSADTD